MCLPERSLSKCFICCQRDTSANSQAFASWMSLLRSFWTRRYSKSFVLQAHLCELYAMLFVHAMQSTIASAGTWFAPFSYTAVCMLIGVCSLSTQWLCQLTSACMQCRNPTIMSAAVDLHDSIIRRVMYKNYGHEVCCCYSSQACLTVPNPCLRMQSHSADPAHYQCHWSLYMKVAI